MKRRPLLFALALPLFVLLFITAIWLALQSAFVVNRLAALAAPLIGYRVRVESISFAPDLHGRISGLAIDPLNGKDSSIFCSNVEIKGTVKNVISAEVERLVLTGPRLFFRLDASGKKTDLSALEKLPPVRLLLIEQGEVDISYGAIHMKLTDLRADVKNFSPETGGSARFEAAIEAHSEGNSGPSGLGRCKGNIDASGPLNNPKAKGTAELLVASASIGTTSIRDFSLSSVFDLNAKNIVLKPVTVSVGSLVMASDTRTVNIEGYAVEAKVSYEFDSTRIAVESANGKAPGVGSFTAAYQGSLRGDAPWNASLEAASVNFTQVYANAKPLLPEDYRTWSVQGAGVLEIKGGGSPDGTWKADVLLKFRQGGFKSADASKAGQRITGSVTLKLRSGPENKKTRFDLALSAGGGELLWGTYYRNFEGESVKVASQGSYSPDAEPFLDGSGSIDLFGTGQYDFSGRIGDEESLITVTGKNLSHQRLFSIFLKDYLHENNPRFSDIQTGGQSDFNVKVKIKAGQAFGEGTLRIAEPSFVIPEVVALRGLTLSLPFDFSYPPAPPADDSRVSEDALLKIARLQKGSIQIEDLEIPFVLSRNSLRLLRDIDVKLYGGELHIPRLEARGLFSTEPTLTTALSLEHLDLGLLTREWVDTEVSGEINADFSGITYRRERWVTKGKLLTEIFGGSMELTNVFAENLFSEARKIGFDLFFRDIDLEKVTEKVALGKMTGIIKGSIANFVMEYGQPARFFLDIESDPTKKTSQLISVAAVENLSVLGTGSSGISSVLNTGVHRFFKEYPYSRIGILCTLENDTFSIRGKIHESGKEYLVRRGWLRGIDVIIQNPQNSINFGDMEERIGRIFRAKEGPQKIS